MAERPGRAGQSNLLRRNVTTFYDGWFPNDNALPDVPWKLILNSLKTIAKLPSNAKLKHYIYILHYVYINHARANIQYEALYYIFKVLRWILKTTVNILCQLKRKGWPFWITITTLTSNKIYCSCLKLLSFSNYFSLSPFLLTYVKWNNLCISTSFLFIPASLSNSFFPFVLTDSICAWNGYSA